MTRRRVAIIGLGMAVGPHAKSLLDLADRVEIAAAISRSPERAAAFAKQFPIPTTTDLRAIVDDTSITAALVLTPPWSHLDVVRTLAGARRSLRDGWARPARRRLGVGSLVAAAELLRRARTRHAGARRRRRAAD